MDFSLLTFGELLHPLNGDLKNQTRNFEKQKKQILSAKYVILFNQTYIYIYIYILSHNIAPHFASSIYSIYLRNV